MPKTFYGYHVNGLTSSVNKVLAQVQKDQPALMVVVNNRGLASLIKDASPDTVVVLRKWPDDNLHMQVAPQNRAQELIAYAEGDKRLVLQLDNEPHGNLALHATWSVAAATYLADRGWTAGVGNYAVGSYQIEQIKTDMAPLLNAVKELKAYLLLHEYGSCHLLKEIGVLQMPSEHLGNNLWRFWYVGRLQQLIHFAPQVPRERIAISEFGIEPIEMEHNNRRCSSLPDPAIQAQQALTVYEKIYKHLGIVGAAHFYWTDAGDWAEYNKAGDAFSHYRHLISTYDYGIWRKDMEKTPTYIAGIIEKKEGNAFANVRSGPSTSATIVTRLTDRLSARVADSHVLDWYHVITAQWTGYIYKNACVFTPDPPPPPPPPPPPAEDRTDDAAMREAYYALLQKLALFYADLGNSYEVMAQVTRTLQAYLEEELGHAAR